MQVIYYGILALLAWVTIDAALQPGARFDFIYDPAAWVIVGGLLWWIFRDHKPRRRHDPHCPVHGHRGNHLSGP